MSKVRYRGSRVEGRGSRVEGRGSRVEGRGSRVEGRGSRVEGRGSRVEEVKKLEKFISYLKLEKYNANRAVRLFSTLAPCACHVSV